MLQVMMRLRINTNYSEIMKQDISISGTYSWKCLIPNFPRQVLKESFI